MGKNENRGCLDVLLDLFRIPKQIPFNLCSLHPSILTKNELDFYNALKEVVGNKLVILAKVRLSDIFKVSDGKGYYQIINRINPRHIDFLLCHPVSFKAVLAIEIDDRSHSLPKRVERDDFINELFNAIPELPLLRLPAQKTYKAEYVRDQVITALGLKKSSTA